MRHAKLSNSDRLQRALTALQTARGRLNTKELADKADICAVSATIAELRANGAEITCTQEVKNGQRRFFYTLNKSPEKE